MMSLVRVEILKNTLTRYQKLSLLVGIHIYLLDLLEVPIFQKEMK